MRFMRFPDRWTSACLFYSLMALCVSGCCGIARVPSVETVKKEVVAIHPGMDADDAAKILREKGFSVGEWQLTAAERDAVKKGRWHPTNPDLQMVVGRKTTSVCLLTDTYIAVIVRLDFISDKVTSVTVEEGGEGP